jgi:hypothetical protein
MIPWFCRRYGRPERGERISVCACVCVCVYVRERVCVCLRERERFKIELRMAQEIFIDRKGFLYSQPARDFFITQE